MSRLAPELLLDMLFALRLTRAIDTRINVLYRQGKIFGGIFPCTGQEAIAVGAASALEPDDIFAGTHRDLGAFVYRGTDPKKIFTNYLGKRTSPTGGKDGTIHFRDDEAGMLPFSSLMGDVIPIAAGVALSFRLRGENRVVLCTFGDGASSRGDFHEGLNFASVRRLPVVYLCNNNHFAYSTPNSNQMNIESVADRAPAYGIPGAQVDGTDVLAVHEVVREAVQRARYSEGPTLIEAKTLRQCGHSGADNAEYVPAELKETWAVKDPLLRFETYLRDEGILTEAKAEEMETAIRQTLDEAVAYAENESDPEGSEALAGVYAE